MTKDIYYYEIATKGIMGHVIFRKPFATMKELFEWRHDEKNRAFLLQYCSLQYEHLYSVERIKIKKTKPSRCMA